MSPIATTGSSCKSNTHCNSSLTFDQSSNNLVERCQFFLVQGLALSACRFITQLNAAIDEFLPARQSCEFQWLPSASRHVFLNRTDRQPKLSLVKVYRSVVCSLHLDNGLPEPLVNRLQLQHLLRSIKHVQGSSLLKRLPITNDLLRVIQRALDFDIKDHVMLWATCCLGFFCFLHIKCCDIYVGCSYCSVCPVLTLGHYLLLHGAATGPLFMYDDELISH